MPGGVDLDRKPHDPEDGSWVESPQKKFERLLYETGIPIGLIFQESSRPAGLSARVAAVGLYHVPARSHPQAGRPPGLYRAQGPAQSPADPRPARLGSGFAQILAESRKFQNEVSTQLAEQVLAALFELIKGFEAADEESRGRLLAGIRDRSDRTHEIYEGLLTVLMRLVFLLYAEEREIFPSDDLFVRNYSIAGLFARLVEDEGRHPDTMDQRYGAWAHLISLFRLV